MLLQLISLSFGWCRVCIKTKYAIQLLKFSPQKIEEKAVTSQETIKLEIMDSAWRKACQTSRTRLPERERRTGVNWCSQGLRYAHLRHNGNLPFAVTSTAYVPNAPSGLAVARPSRAGPPQPRSPHGILRSGPQRRPRCWMA